MFFLSAKEQVELIASRLETATYILTLLAAIAGFSFLMVNRRLQRFTKVEFSAFQKTIAETNALSEAAKADAATARAQIEESKTERTKLELKIKEIEQSHSKLAATNAENEQQLARLQEARKPRTISPAQSYQIANLLRPFAGQTVVLQRYAQDNETTQFTNQIISVLQSAGLQTTSAIMMGASGTGFAIVVHDTQSVPPLAGCGKRGDAHLDHLQASNFVTQGRVL
ncbi:MAG: hypothetical protein WA578_12165, partial [Candidatus Sulfotelmatobacter sp.]